MLCSVGFANILSKHLSVGFLQVEVLEQLLDDVSISIFPGCAAVDDRGEQATYDLMERTRRWPASRRWKPTRVTSSTSRSDNLS